MINRYMVLLILLLLVSAVIWILVRLYYCKQMEVTYQGILQKLDRAIGGELQDTVFDESMDAAVTERLNRFVCISGMHQKNAEKERDIIKSLISDISHQVRTPLTNIMLYTGLMQEKNLDQSVMLLADKIRRQSDKLDFFMRELVKSSYAEREIISVHPRITSVGKMISTACQMSEVVALHKKIDIFYEETEAVCYADDRWTTEAIGNVLENAIKYSPEYSTVRISVTAYESFVCIEVRDKGMGIREEEQGMVFERFYRSKDACQEPGFGIGLFLVREILSKQGGYVKIKSEVNQGTAVCLYLSRYVTIQNPWE